jgi:hypothetical protein
MRSVKHAARIFIPLAPHAPDAAPVPYVACSYLEERGVDTSLVEYLVELSIDKEQREYVNWLKRVGQFVGKSKK